ncbi:hypothetical protein H0H92_001429 [Tricholoma furcatifolium]|nr:hypothetical protein H0H92_001429 [Tricholoma furcatifolium]
MNGNNYDCIYDPDVSQSVQYAFKAGHQIASHTWSHPDLTTIGVDEINSQLSLNNGRHPSLIKNRSVQKSLVDAFRKICGVVPAFMRPPFGSYNDDVLQVAGNQNQFVVTWDFDSGDSIGKTADESMALYDQVVGQRLSTLLTLNHETEATTAKIVLPHAISILKAAGYELVTVAECLGMSPYLSQAEPSQRDVSYINR